jgi:hypothetical protein
MAELIMGMFTFLVIFSAILMMVQASVHSQDRVAKRVASNQRARPVMTRIVDALHSACVAPAIAPVLAGSTGNSIAFTSRFGSSVSPTPDKRVITLSGFTLSEAVYPATGGAPPTWTFSPTPTISRVMLTGVSAGKTGSPSVAVPLFRYYAYIGGVVSPTPLPVPLSAADAAKTVQVDIAFASSPSSTPSPDATTPITLTDSTTLRLEPASEDSAEVNLPCV